MAKILVVCGPTASGKTDLALKLSKRFGGEMVCADSMQIYKGLPIGTAAVLPHEAEGIVQHMTGFLPPQQSFSVAQWCEMANQAVQDILARGALPIICGGTGLYISSLVKGVRFTDEMRDDTLGKKLEEEWAQAGAEGMHARLAVVDPDCAARLHMADKKRILRALKSYTLTGKTAKERERDSLPERPPYNALIVAPGCADREYLYSRINARVDDMLQKGLLDEARYVYENRNSFTTAAQAIGFKELFPYLEGTASLEECANRLKQATRNYAKRQLTWFRHMDDVHWVDIQRDAMAEAAALAGDFLHS